ncbi:putative solute carrier family 35 member G1 [Apostichopus japonicus]|uniref:Putative solute carrier family 35 member G1 n=1 Tax=Stichopus japonicus TaxID=307972 RepID=A0A2G8KGX0_STIJA|nr:putative solute carrier family 35 member G1 [Apostichopus japonicus]
MAAINAAFVADDNEDAIAKPAYQINSIDDVIAETANQINSNEDVIAETANQINSNEDVIAAETADQINSNDVVNGNLGDTDTFAELETPIDHPSKLQLLRLQIHKRRGLLFALLSALLFSSEDAVMDVLAKTLDVFQITFTVSILTVVLSGACLFFGKIKPPAGRWQWTSLAISGITLSLGMPTALLSLKYMDVGASIAIIYTMPIFTGIFAWIILKEPMKLIHLLFVAVSFAGVLLIAQPEFIFGSNEEENPDNNALLGTIFALVSAVAFALLVVISRKQAGAGMNMFVLMFYNAIVTAVVNSLTCTGLQAWAMPSLVNWLELFGFAFLDFWAQITLIMALILEAAILVSITTTIEVLFAFIWQITIFRVYPDWKTGVGAVLIVSTCVGIAFTSSESEHDLSETKTEDIDPVQDKITTSEKVEPEIAVNVDENVTVRDRYVIERI